MSLPLFGAVSAACRRCVRLQRRLVTSRRMLQRAAARGAGDGADPPPAVSIDSLGAWDSRIELQLDSKSSLKHGKPIPKIGVDVVGVSSLQGRRRYQEDRCVVSEAADDVLLAAILDGHGGAACSQFCGGALLQVVQDVLATGERNLMTVLQETFPVLNRLFSEYWLRERGVDVDSPGTTATVCLLRGGAELVIGHVGDSRAILCRDGEARKLTSDHSAALLAERRRVEQSGGTVTVDEVGHHRVDGRLAMTRSIGDLHLKKHGVTAFPDTRSLQVRHGRDAFLALTTDGINHVLTDQEVCDVVNGCRTPAEAAHALTDQALSCSADDNISCVIVPFGSWGKFTDKASIFVSFGKTMSTSSRFS